MLPPDEGVPITALETYRALSDSIFSLYGEGDQRAALTLLDDLPPDLLPWQAELAHLKACLHGSLGEHDEALATLETAHAAGAWWDPAILVDDDDLASLVGLPAFASLVDSSKARWVLANADLDRSGDRLALPTGSPRGLLVALHGAEEDAGDAIVSWEAAVELGFGVLAVRSSQRTSPAYRSWPDQTRAAAEIADALGALPAGVRSLPVVAAGFSAGGRVALRWALSGEPCAVAGVIAVAPAVSEDLERAGASTLDPGVVVIGGEDDLLDDVVAAGQVLRDSGVMTDIVPGLGHGFPEDFPQRLQAALGSMD